VRSNSVLGWLRTGRGRATTGLAAIAGATLVAWAFVQDAGPSIAPSPPPASPPVRIRASGAAPASAPAAVATVAAPDSSDEVQICGGAWVKAVADGQADKEQAEAFNRRMLEATRAQTLAAMETSADERARAAAYYFQYSLNRVFEACSEGNTCTRPTEVQRQAADWDRTALVRLAQSSTDPQIYAWAYRSCNDPALGSEAPCQLITSAQWARLDASNGAPWLFLAAEAEKRGDASALDDAMFHVASAERQEQGWGVLPAMLIEHAPPGETYLTGAFGLAGEAFGVDAAGTAPYATATKYCVARNLADANRRETCEGVATLLVERSNTFLERAIGIGMAKRLGWPQERIRSIEEERDALYEAATREASSTVELSSCKDVRRALDHFREIGAHGELGSARNALAASGRAIPLLAAQYRQSMAEEQHEARREEAAASAASAAADRSEH
jgi:hypothetical protein